MNKTFGLVETEVLRTTSVKQIAAKSSVTVEMQSISIFLAQSVYAQTQLMRVMHKQVGVFECVRAWAGMQEEE